MITFILFSFPILFLFRLGTMMEGYIGGKFIGDENNITRIDLEEDHLSGIIPSTPPDVMHTLRQHTDSIGGMMYDVLVVDDQNTIVRIVRMRMSEIGTLMDKQKKPT